MYQFDGARETAHSGLTAVSNRKVWWSEAGLQSLVSVKVIDFIMFVLL